MIGHTENDRTVSRFAVLCCAVFAVSLLTVSLLAGTAWSADPSAKIKLSSARELTPGPDGRVWFFARSSTAKRAALYAASINGKARKVSLPGFAAKSARGGAIGIGGDGKLWVSASGVPKKGRTTIYCIGQSGKASSIRLAKGREVFSLAGDAAGRTWFLGYSSRRVGYFDSKRRVHSVTVPKASTLESLVEGPDGAMWASSRDAVAIFSKSGYKTRIQTPTQPTPGIAVGGGSAWVSGIGGLSKMAKDRSVVSLPLQYPMFSLPPTTRTGYTYFPFRISFSVFSRPDAAIGFTSGTSSNGFEEKTSIVTGVGGVNSVGSVNESDPATAAYPSWIDNSNPGDRLYPVRRTEAKLATVDRKRNLWAATDEGVEILPLPPIP